MREDPILAERLNALGYARADIVTFTVAFVAGLACYTTLHVLEFSQLVQTAAILVTMGGYAIAVWKIPRLRLRLDQAGDNAYYLGLLFTLVSMAMALYEFSSKGRSGVDHIITNFGIALASTILGIFLRVILHQMRVDPGEVEQMTRIDLAEAAGKVKAAIETVTQDLASFHDVLRQRTSDTLETLSADYRRAVSEVADKLTKAGSQLVAGTEEAQRSVIERSGRVCVRLEATAESARVAMEKLQKVEPPPTELASRLDKVRESLERLTSPIETVADASSKVLSSIGAATDKLGAFTRGSQQQHEAVLTHIVDAAKAFQQALAEAGDTMRQDLALHKHVHAQVDASVSEARRAHETRNLAVDALTGVARDLTRVIRDKDRRDG